MWFMTNKGRECDVFFRDYLTEDRRVLFIGTLGFNDLCLEFPLFLASNPNTRFLFLVEERPEVSEILKAIAARNKDILVSEIGADRVQFQAVAIVADDTANVAGRNAVRACRGALSGDFTDMVVDASSMSRGVCFPIVKQIFELSKATGALSGRGAHIVMAGRSQPSVRATQMSSDAPQYIHGFQGDMGTDQLDSAIKLWIPQLSEGATASLSRIHRTLRPHETCPILPFPSGDPRRGDLLLREFRAPILNDWEVNLLDVIYAHEADPTDVCETITRIHSGRAEAFSRSTTDPARTILSPAGTRIGSVGMLLAALRLDLPVIYEESIGYNSNLTTIPELPDDPPEYRWHVWLNPQ